MRGRTGLSAALAASLFAADLVILVLFLNPDVRLVGEAPALLLALFLPYFLVGAVGLLLLAGLVRLLPGMPRVRRPPLETLPWFTSLALVAVSAAAGLYWLNLL